MFHAATDSESSAVRHGTTDSGNTLTRGERALALTERVHDTREHTRTGATADRIACAKRDLHAGRFGNAGARSVSAAHERADRHAPSLAAARALAPRATPA